MEFEILHGIQVLRSDLLDQIMIFITKLGDAGLFWIGLGLVLAIIPKTRKCGLSVLGAMALTFILGNLILKNLVARPRPFTVDTSVPLIIPQPGEFSFPSGHTMNGFAAAVLSQSRYCGLITSCVHCFFQNVFVCTLPHRYSWRYYSGCIRRLADLYLSQQVGSCMEKKEFLR